MLRQQENHLPAVAHRAGMPTLAGVGKGVMGTPRQPVLTFQVGSALDPGIQRKQEPNEDTISITRGVIPSTPAKPFALFLVADGMGGQGHGQEASRLAREALVEYITHALCSEQVDPQAYLPLLRAGVQSANHIVYQRNRERSTVMGTTMTVCLVVDASAYVAHVGDSRCYLYRDPDGLSQITLDHSIVAALVGAGVIKPEDIYTHPSRNLIYRYVGEKASVEVDTFEIPLVAGDILLLCSDGLWEMVRDPQIAALLASRVPDPTQTVHTLVQAALAHGGADNVSAIVVRVDKR
jgi:serine/threonine protein phosphatase PrpC